MNKKMFVEDFFVAFVFGIIFLFVDFRISIGIIIGYVFSILNYKMIEYRFKNLKKVSIFMYLGTFISIGILVLPLLVSVLIPNVMSWIGVFIGLMINRSRLIIEAFVKK